MINIFHYILKEGLNLKLRTKLVNEGILTYSYEIHNFIFKNKNYFKTRIK